MEPQIDLQRLVRAAWEARKAAYAPYSGFRVGSAVLGVSGGIYRGCNVENVSFGLSICAERAAVFAALEAGEQEFTAVAVVTAAAYPAPPCGACRQVLAEFSPSLLVVSENESGDRLSWNLDLLLPDPFSEKLGRTGMGHTPPAA
jgi:cytidine deaminase